MITTIDERFQLVSRPMVLHVGEDFDGTIFLFAHQDSRVVANITARASSWSRSPSSKAVAGRSPLMRPRSSTRPSLPELDGTAGRSVRVDRLVTARGR
ncbi:hypothetical protein [Nocardia mangyaensis]|uniref:hypothetical protein n=1 Tax=Nocardia mangyaensis TaxID=2213200 RepID=UPI003B832FB4